VSLGASGASEQGSEECKRCERTCSFFDGDPSICCNQKCRRACPELVKSFNCAPLATASGHKCQKCQHLCDTFGSSCCIDKECRECADTEAFCESKGYAPLDSDSSDSDSSSVAEMVESSTGINITRLGANLPSVAAVTGADTNSLHGALSDLGEGIASGASSGGEGLSGTLDRFASSLADYIPSAGKGADTGADTLAGMRLSAACMACNQSIAAVGAQFGCSATCRQECPALVKQLGCSDSNEESRACFKCSATCSLLGTASYSTRTMCCQETCLTHCPSTMASYNCSGSRQSMQERFASQYGIDSAAFKDNATAIACEGCISACKYIDSAGPCCSTWCQENCYASAAERPDMPHCTAPVAEDAPVSSVGGQQAGGPSMRSSGSPGKGAGGPARQSSGRGKGPGRSTGARSPGAGRVSTGPGRVSSGPGAGTGGGSPVGTDSLPSTPSTSPVTARPTRTTAGKGAGNGARGAGGEDGEEQVRGVIPMILCNAPIMGDVRLTSYPAGIAQMYTGEGSDHVWDPADPDFGWRTICGWHDHRSLTRNWNAKGMAQVICRQLGYASAVNQSERQAVFEMMVDEGSPVSCSGSEPDVRRCRDVTRLMPRNKRECTSGVFVRCGSNGAHLGPSEPVCGSSGPAEANRRHR